jgi:hypothetical protein
MIITRKLRCVIIILILSLVGCTIPKLPPNEQQVRDLAWQEVNPYTLSHNRDSWEIIEIKKVIGRDIVGQFENEHFSGGYFYGCWEGPTIIAPNSGIEPFKSYWYVQMEPRPATPLPQHQTVSSTEIPIIPEPFMFKALFLIDVTNGRVVARNLYCVTP